MADESQQTLTWLLRFNTETGKLEDVTEKLKAAGVNTKGLGDQAKETGSKSHDVFDKIGHDVTKMAFSIGVAQLALEGFKKVMQESSAFQELKATFEDTALTLVNDLEPALGMISRGVQGILVWAGGILGFVKPIVTTVVDLVKAMVDELVGVIGAAINFAQGDIRGGIETFKASRREAQGEFKGLGDDFKKSWDGMVTSWGAGVDRIKGKNKAMTAEMADELAERLNREMAHAQAVAKVKDQTAARELTQSRAHAAQRIAEIRRQETQEIALTNQEENTKLALLRSKLASRQITQAQFNSQHETLEQQFADKRVAIHEKSSDQIVAIQDAERQKMEAIMGQQIAAFSKALAERLATTHNFQDALQYALATEIQMLTTQAMTAITIEGQKAAATAFAHGMAVGGWPGAIASAAAVEVKYAAYAAAVGAIGFSVANAVVPGTVNNAGSSGDAGGGAASGASGSAASVTKAPAAGATSSSKAAMGTTSSSKPAGVTTALDGSTGQGQMMRVTVNIGGKVLIDTINEASRDGQLIIQANSVIGSR